MDSSTCTAASSSAVSASTGDDAECFGKSFGKHKIIIPIIIASHKEMYMWVVH